MRLQARLAKLERSRPAHAADAVALDLAPDVEARIEAAILADTFPQSLTIDDLQAIVDAANAAGG